MANEVRFDGKVVIVTGAGGGLGRSHALLFGSRGAKVIVNDLGGAMTGGGRSSAAADKVVAEIKAAGGEAAASYDSVEDGAKIVQAALDSFGRLDIVVNNAGILRDTSFAKMTEEDWDLIYRVHVLGAFRVTHAAWPHFYKQQYGRVVMTASAAGIYGNFGQANYSMAKLGLLGLSNTLAIEGRKKGIHVNTVAPLAGSRLTETVLPKELIDALKPEYVSPLVAWLCHESCTETGGLYEVGGGYFAKLRWERSKGKSYRIGRTMTVEGVKEAWGEIAGFDGAEHPADIAQSMQAVMANVQAGPSKGGNDLIDVDLALGYEYPERTSRYDERDLSIYALGVGAAADPLDDKELALVYEMHGSGFKALPTYGVIPPMNQLMTMAKEGLTAPGLKYGLDRLLHGEQYTELLRPLPPSQKLTHRSRIKEIWDKGKGALVVTETKSYDEAGELLIVNEFTAFIRGAGGWGGDRGPSTEINLPPDRPADATASEKIGASQALLYRLSGDWNPLHADPNFAKAFGFERPILHGLCTFGYAARHVVKQYSNGDPRYFKSIKVRFADSVFPGETLVTEMWKESDTRIVFRCKVKERDKVVISNAAIELYREIPQPKAKAAPAAAKPAAAATAAPAAAAVPTSDDIFTAIGAFLKKTPELSSKVGKIFQFKLTAPDSVWTVDVKAAPGAVARGGSTPADCTLELTDADFMGMCTGKLDAQKLYFGGKLKISGDLMASQRLEFLRKLDPALVVEAMQARGAGAPAAAAPAAAAAAAPAASAGPSSEDVFLALTAYVGEHPELVAKTGAVFLFDLSEPATQWTLDLKNAKGSVVRGKGEAPDCTLALSEGDFMDMSTGKVDPQKLYFGGKLKISGNVMASTKLSFLQKIDPAWAAQAVAKLRGEMAAAKPAAATAPVGAAAPARAPAGGAKAAALFAALGKRLAAEPGLAKDIGAAIAFKVTAPAAAYTVDLRTAPGSVKDGAASDAGATLTLADADLAALAAGSAAAQDLFQRGRLRVDGDVRLAQKLGFLKGLGA
ncbi:MAG: SDR family NAD(P)-dependent oxidoreductase [Polyangiaceae bacterium]|nr:SDR family NAD(P)-dependent oxidoreductase [Polyangiaceae bacterium]